MSRKETYPCGTEGTYPCVTKGNVPMWHGRNVPWRHGRKRTLVSRKETYPCVTEGTYHGVTEGNVPWCHRKETYPGVTEGLVLCPEAGPYLCAGSVGHYDPLGVAQSGSTQLAVVRAIMTAPHLEEQYPVGRERHVVLQLDSLNAELIPWRY